DALPISPERTSYGFVQTVAKALNGKPIAYYLDKSGCCSAIGNYNTLSEYRLYFHLPLWLTPFSVGKIRRYVEDLNELGVPLRVIGVFDRNQIPIDPEDPSSETTSSNLVLGATDTYSSTLNYVSGATHCIRTRTRREGVVIIRFEGQAIHQSVLHAHQLL